MDEIGSVFFSWQFLLIGIIVYFIFAFFNEFLGPRLWSINNRRWRSVMKFLDGIKVVWPPIFGFLLGWVPGIPRPSALSESSTLTLALLYFVAGLGCQWIVKGVKKYIESRGIDVDLDLSPKQQKKTRSSVKLG